jgi:hypothetical protein
MQAFCSQIMALRTLQPTTVEEQWSQVTCLAGMLLPITPVRKQDLLTLVSTLQVTGEPLEHLNRKIGLLKDGGEARWQDWSFIQHYVTEHLVRHWTSDQVAASPIQTLIWHVLNWAQMMGLMKPSQSTFQAITCIILIIKDGTAWDPVRKKELFDSVKMHFKRVSAIRQPAVYIANLPMPANLKDLVPSEWWMTAFGVLYTSCSFVTYDNLLFERVVATIPMRSTRLDVRDTQLMQQRRPSFGAQPPADANMAGMMNLLQGFMQSIGNPRGHQPLEAGAASWPAPQPLALIPPEPAMEVAADTPAPQPQPQPQPVASTAAAGGAHQPMTLQDVVAVLDKTPTTKKIKKKPAACTIIKKPATAAAKHAPRTKGCSKCRGKPGCTPSCIRLRTQPYP